VLLRTAIGLLLSLAYPSHTPVALTSSGMHIDIDHGAAATNGVDNELPIVHGHSVFYLCARPTPPPEQLSHVAFVFPHGQIDAQAAISLPPTNFTAAITGGTGAYKGVGGEVVNTVISRTPLTVDRTLF
jgi:hypothetical protein